MVDLKRRAQLEWERLEFDWLNCQVHYGWYQRLPDTHTRLNLVTKNREANLAINQKELRFT